MLKIKPRSAAEDAQNDLTVQVVDDELGDRLERCEVTLEWVPDAGRLIVEVKGVAKDDVTVETVVRP